MTDEDTARTAINIKTITDALYEIHEQSSYIMDKGDVLGAGRRLERIHRAAHTALKACDAQEW